MPPRAADNKIQGASGLWGRAAAHQPRRCGHCARAGLGALWRAWRRQHGRRRTRSKSGSRSGRKSAIALAEQRRAVFPGALAGLDHAQRPGHCRMTVRRRAAREKMRPGNRPNVGDEGGVTMPAFAPSDISRDGPGMSGQRRQPPRPALGDELQPRLFPRPPCHRPTFLTVADNETVNLTANSVTRKACAYPASPAIEIGRQGASAR